MSQYTHEVIRCWREFVAGASDDEVPDLGWVQNGYLFVCDDDAAAGQLAS
jgi:hypothetical protein